MPGSVLEKTQRSLAVSLADAVEHLADKFLALLVGEAHSAAEALRIDDDSLDAGGNFQRVVFDVLARSTSGSYTGNDWLANHALGEEVFGPLGLVVRSSGADQMQDIARSTARILAAAGIDCESIRKLFRCEDICDGAAVCRGNNNGHALCTPGALDAVHHAGREEIPGQQRC